MHRASTSKTLLLWIVAVAFVAVRMVDAHIHLCLDGKEPPSSLHIGDRGPHHAPSNESSGHVDTDVSLVSQMLLKTSKTDLDDLPLMLLGALVLWCVLARRAQRVAGIDRYRPRVRAPFYLRPVLRGPPSLASL